jgi:hypothetical protein
VYVDVEFGSGETQGRQMVKKVESKFPAFRCDLEIEESDSGEMLKIKIGDEI